MAAARVDLNGALIRPVDDPYYNQQGWGSPQAQPWWTEYNLGNTTPMATSNTPQISGGSLIGNALKQGWTAMVSPRKGLSEATTEVKPLEGGSGAPNEAKPPEGLSEATTQVNPPVTTATAATQPPAPPVVIQSATTVPIAPQQTAMPIITGVPQTTLVPGVQLQQPSLVPGTVTTMQPTTTVPTVGMPNTGLPMVGATQNGLSTLATNPATAQVPTGLELIMAQLANLEALSQKQAKQLEEQSKKLDALTAEKAKTKTEEKKPVKENEKVASSS